MILPNIGPYWNPVPEDTRFQYRWKDQTLEVTFIDPDDNDRKVGQFAGPTAVNQAYKWMLEQPRRPNSLRLGDKVSQLTSSLGIPECGACARRHLKLNS